jgi:DNA-binding transcriptional regulator GbsR (MarR family)
MGNTVPDQRSATMDRLAATLEASGFPRSMARVYSALMLAEGEGLSTSELMDDLGVSKASITGAMHFLLGTELVERYRVRGSREAHYRILKGRWGAILSKKFAAYPIVRDTVADAISQAASPEAKERLQEMYDVYAFFATELQDVMSRWNARNEEG